MCDGALAALAQLDHATALLRPYYTGFEESAVSPDVGTEGAGDELPGQITEIVSADPACFPIKVFR